MIKERFPALNQFFACYFHQDWVLEARDWESVVLGYLGSEPPDLVKEATSQLGQFLALKLEGNRLEEALYELGNFYYPRPGQSHEAWLHQLFGFLKEHQPA